MAESEPVASSLSVLPHCTRLLVDAIRHEVRAEVRKELAALRTELAALKAQQEALMRRPPAPPPPRPTLTRDAPPGIEEVQEGLQVSLEAQEAVGRVAMAQVGNPWGEPLPPFKAAPPGFDGPPRPQPLSVPAGPGPWERREEMPPAKTIPPWAAEPLPGPAGPLLVKPPPQTKPKPPVLMPDVA